MVVVLVVLQDNKLDLVMLLLLQLLVELLPNQLVQVPVLVLPSMANNQPWLLDQALAALLETDTLVEVLPHPNITANQTNSTTDILLDTLTHHNLKATAKVKVHLLDLLKVKVERLLNLNKVNKVSKVNRVNKVNKHHKILYLNNLLFHNTVLTNSTLNTVTKTIVNTVDGTNPPLNSIVSIT